MVQIFSKFLVGLNFKDAVKLASPAFLGTPITIISVPLCLSAIGLHSYGLLMILFLLTNQSHVLLLGIEKNLTREIIKKNTVTTNLYSAQIMSLLYGLTWSCLIIISFKISNFSQKVLLPDPVLLLFLAGIPIHLVWLVQRSILQAKKEFSRLGVTTFAYMNASQYAPLIAVLFLKEQSDLTSFLFATLASRFVIVLYCAMAKPTESQIVDLQSFSNILRLIRYGKWLGFNQLIQMFFDGVDRYLLALFTSPSTVALYSIALQVSQKLAVFPIAISQVVFNETAALKLKRSRGYLQAVLGFSPLLAIFYFSAANFLFRLWLGPHFTPAILEVATLIYIAVNFTSFNFVLNSIIEGSGQASKLTKQDAYLSLPMITTIALLCYHSGALGAACGLLLKEVVFFYFRLRILPPTRKILNHSLISIIVIGVAAAVSMILVKSQLFMLLSQMLLMSLWLLSVLIGRRLKFL